MDFKFNFKEFIDKSFGKNKDEKSHAKAMLIIYGVFILVLVLAVRLTPAAPPRENVIDEDLNGGLATPGENGNTNKPSDGKIYYNINYSYVFTINSGDTKEVITGKKLDEKEIFTIINNDGAKDYAKLSDNYLVKENGEYHLTDCPSTFLKYTDMDSLYYLTGLNPVERNGDVLKYLVKANDVLKYYNKDSIESIDDSVYDSITITAVNDVMKSIDIDYTNYYSKVTGNGLTIKIEFNNVGTTEDFNVTLSN